MNFHRLTNKAHAISLIAVFIMIVFAACTGAGTAGETGTLALSLSDAATDDYQAVYVTVGDIQVHLEGDEAAETDEDDAEAEGSWQTVMSLDGTYNLLDLVNGVRTELGAASIAAGNYSQMRLIIGETPDDGLNIFNEAHPFANYVIDTDGTVHELKVPSGMQTGVKIVQGFTVSTNGTTELILDFDASASVVIAGSSGQYLLKPTIKILETVEASIISGTVTVGADAQAVEGALVTAQIYNPDAADEADQVTVEAGTVTEANGEYALFIMPGTYNLVITKEGYAAAAERVNVAAGETLTKDVSLNATETGNAAGAVIIADADTEAFATLSFRQDVTLEETAETIQVLSVNVANGGAYSATLPAGEYGLVSSADEKTTVATDVTITAEATTTADVSF